MTTTSDGKRDFLVSFNKADRPWATWIAWVLEEARYSVWFSDWDFKGNFILEMDKAHQLSRRTVAVLSPDYPQPALASICDDLGSATDSGRVASVARLVQSWCKPLRGPYTQTPPTRWIGGFLWWLRG